VATKLHAFATAAHAALVTAGITDVDMRVGRKAFSFHGAKRRIAWIEPRGKLTAPLQGGGRQATTASTSRIVACKTREAEVHAFIYGGDDDATEQLFEALVAAICNLGEARAEMPSYRWVTEEEQHSGHTNRTDCIELIVIVRLPVSAESKPLTAITGVDDVCGTLGGTESAWTITPHG
jgi:hypothetical protein